MAVTAAELEIVVGADTKGAEKGLDNLSTKTKNFSKGDIAGASTALLGFGLAGAFAFTSMIGTAADFQAQMSAVGSVTGATQAQLGMLEEEALRLGSSTSMSASEAASAMETMAKAGVPLQDILNGATEDAINLANATGTDIVLSSETAAAAMTQFGVSSEEAADIIAQSANASSMDVNDWALALKSAGPVAAALGIPMEDLAAGMMILADSGIRGEVAATAMRNTLMNLSNPTDAVSKSLNELGVSSTYADGKFKGLDQIMTEMVPTWGTLTDAQKMFYAEQIAGKDGAASFLTLMNAQSDAVANNTNAFDERKKAMAGVGTAEEQAKARMDNFNGALETLKGALETAAIIVGGMFLPALQRLAEIGTEVIAWFLQLNPNVQKSIAIVAGLAFGLAALAGVMGLVSMAGGVLAAGMALIFSPVVLIVAAIAALAAGLIYAYTHFEGFRKVVDKAASATKDFAKLVGKNLLKGFDKLMDVVKPIGKAIVSEFKDALPVLKQVARVVGGAVVAGFRLFSDILSTVAGYIGTVVRWIAQGVSAFADWAARTGVASAALNVLIAPIQALIGFFGAVWDAVSLVIDAFGEGGLLGALKALPEAFTTIGSAFFDLVTAIPKALLELGQAVLTAINSIDWGGVASNVVDLVVSGISNGASAASGIWNWLVDSLSSTFSAVWSFVTSAISLAWDAITSLDWGDFISAVDLAMKVINLAWDLFVTGVDLGVKAVKLVWRNFVKGVDLTLKVIKLKWSEFVEKLYWDHYLDETPDNFWEAALQARGGVFAWDNYIKPLAWDSYLNALDLATMVPSLSWGMFVKGTNLATMVPSFSWGVFVHGVTLANWVAHLDWSNFVTAVDLTVKVVKLGWDAYVTAIDLTTKVLQLAWDTYITGIDLTTKVVELAWDDFLSDLTWGDFVTALDWLSYVNPVTWTTWLVELAWDTFVPDVDWGGFIPDLEWPSAADILEAIKSKIGLGGSDKGSGTGDSEGQAAWTNPGTLPDGGGFGLWEMGNDFGGGNSLGIDTTAAVEALQKLSMQLGLTKSAVTSFVADSIAVLGGWSTGVSFNVTNTMSTFKAQLSSGTSTGKQSVITFVADTIGVLGGWATGVGVNVTSTMSSFKSQISSGTSTGKQSFVTFVADTIGVMGGWASGIKTNVTNTMNDLKSKVSQGTSDGKRSFTTFANDTRSTISSWSSNVRSIVSNAMSAVRSTISSGMSQASGTIRSQASSWAGIIGGYAGAMRGAGQSVGFAAGQGVAAGMMSALGMVRSAANQMIAEVDRAMRAKARINSPSKMTAYFGQMMGLGLGNGLDDMVSYVARMGTRLADAAMVQPSNVFAPIPAYAVGPVSRQSAPPMVVHQTFHVTVDVDDIEDLTDAVQFVKDLPTERELVLGV